ncbi:unnamed protein product, partial [Ectocarpus sp. 12 AP-2014]
ETKPALVKSEPVTPVAPLAEVTRPTPDPAANDPVKTEHNNAIRGKFAVMATKNLITMPLTPLQNGDDVVELVQLSSAITKSVEQIRASAQDFDSDHWVRGWEKVLERHLINSVRKNHAKSAATKQILVAAVTQSVRAMDSGMSGPDALQLLLRAVCSGLSTVTPALVLQQLQNFAVPAGTTFK